LTKIRLEIAYVDNSRLIFGEIDGGSKPLRQDSLTSSPRMDPGACGLVSVSSAFRKVTKRLGIEDQYFHSLRHFTASNCQGGYANSFW